MIFDWMLPEFNKERNVSSHKDFPNNYKYVGANKDTDE